MRNTETNAHRNGVGDRVTAARIDIFPWVPEERYEVIVACVDQTPVDPEQQVTGHRPIDYWGRTPLDPVLTKLADALAPEGVAYVVQLSILSQRRTAELLAAAGLEVRVVEYGVFPFPAELDEHRAQIARVERAQRRRPPARRRSRPARGVPAGDPPAPADARAAGLGSCDVRRRRAAARGLRARSPRGRRAGAARAGQPDRRSLRRRGRRGGRSRPGRARAGSTTARSSSSACTWRDAGDGADRRALRQSPLRLSYPLLECELLRRRQARLVADIDHSQPARYAFLDTLGWRAYVAAPILVDGVAVGFLHGDRAPGRRPLAQLDADALEHFAAGFAVVFERAVLRRRLRDQRREIRRISSWAEARSGELSDGAIDAVGRPRRGAGPSRRRAGAAHRGRPGRRT